MSNLYSTPTNLVGEHVCRCCGNDLRHFDRDAVHFNRMNALKSQLN